jgi:hypothetical protein
MEMFNKEGDVVIFGSIKNSIAKVTELKAN